MMDAERPILVFQSDFTYKEGAVSAMYGVVKSVDRALEIIDGTHELPQYDVWSASYRLWQTMRFWPRGTVFVSVVDPGVGTSRRACAAKTADGYYIVTPDNGTLTHALRYHGISEVREIDESVNRRPGSFGTSVFHGRDVFAYCAARLAAGRIDFEGVGEPYPAGEIVSIALPSCGAEPGCVFGAFEIADPNFGNLWTNIPASYIEEAGFAFGDVLTVICRHGGAEAARFPARYCRTFGEVPKGARVIYVNELMNVAAAISQGNLLAACGLGYGPDWAAEIRKGDAT